MDKKNSKNIEKRKYITLISGVCCLLFALCFLLPYIFILPKGYTSTSAHVPLDTVNTPQSTLSAEPTVNATPIATATQNETPFYTATPAPNINLKVGDEADVIETVQMLLMSLGYMDSDMPTTYFGEPLKEAIVVFQRVHYLDQTGEINTALIDLIQSDNARPYFLERGNRGNDVLRLQMRLFDLGFYTSKLNGYYGAATENAVSSFQAMNELVVTGEAEKETFNVLYSPYAKNHIGATPEPIATLSPTPRLTPTPTIRPTIRPTPTPTPRLTPTPTPRLTPTIRPSAPVTTAPVHTNEPTQTPAPTPTLTPTPSPTLEVTPTMTPTPPNGSVEEFIALAMEQLGKPYVWSTEGPDSFDCSGFVYYCLRGVGLNVPRLSAQGFSQVDSWQRIDNASDLRRGDLIFYANDSGGIGHTGIYLGNNRYIHASSSAGRVVISDWGNWSNTYFRLGRRVFD